jgi:protein-tyrosine phosphatase
MSVPPHSARVLGGLRQAGYMPILAHPERYHGVGSIEIAGDWRQAGAYLQVNGGSLLGKYGKRAAQHAWELLERGWVDFLSSDYHTRGSPLINDYRGALIAAGGEEQAYTLMETNPARMLRGEVPLPALPLRRRTGSLWQRVRGLFG